MLYICHKRPGKTTLQKMSFVLLQGDQVREYPDNRRVYSQLEREEGRNPVKKLLVEGLMPLKFGNVRKWLQNYRYPMRWKLNYMLTGEMIQAFGTVNVKEFPRKSLLTKLHTDKESIPPKK